MVVLGMDVVTLRSLLLVSFFCAAGFGQPSVAGAAGDGDAPKIDRVILKKKKPVVDRVVLKKKKTAPAPVPEPPAAPAPLPAPVVKSEPAPPAPVAAAAPGINPVGTAMHLAILSGSLDRTQIGVGYWFDEDWGVNLLTGVHWTREEQNVETRAGERGVTSLSYTVLPEISLLYSPAARKNLRLLVEAGGGLSLFKLARQTPTRRAFHAFAGPAIQWHLASPFSLQLGERAELLTNSKPARYDVGLSTQFTASWWFE